MESCRVGKITRVLGYEISRVLRFEIPRVLK